MQIKTARLTLVPATAALARAEIEDRPAFAALLGAAVPDAWPPETLADALVFFLQQIEAAPEPVGWITWYGVADGETPTLVASGGFFGPPQEGSVEIGYSVHPSFQQKGYGTEMAGVLTECRLGFSETGASSESGHLRFEKVPEGRC